MKMTNYFSRTKNIAVVESTEKYDIDVLLLVLKKWFIMYNDKLITLEIAPKPVNENVVKTTPQNISYWKLEIITSKFCKQQKPKW